MSKVIVIYAGGFQPFHTGHLSSYIQAKKAFPDADFYVATSGDVKKRPIPYEAKKFLATQAGVDPDDFPDVMVKSPLNPREILQKYDPNSDIFVLVRSERDPVSYTKKDGTPGYFQPWTANGQKNSFENNGYVFVTKKQDFNINGQDVYSGTQVRELYRAADDQGRINIIKQLYPRSKKHDVIKGILDKYIGNNEMNERLQKLVKEIKPLLKEATLEQKKRFISILEQVKKDSEKARVEDPKSDPESLIRITDELEEKLNKSEEMYKGLFEKVDKLEKMITAKTAKIELELAMLKRNKKLDVSVTENIDYREEK